MASSDLTRRTGALQSPAEGTIEQGADLVGLSRTTIGLARCGGHRLRGGEGSEQCEGLRGATCRIGVVDHQLLAR
jgi:hypothetical protein